MKVWKIKRTSKDHDEIIKWAEKQRRFRRIISATTALVAGAATYELGSNTAEASAYTEAQHENIENIAPVQEQEFNDSTVEVASQVDEVPLHEQEVTEEHVENNENIANQESVDTEIQDNTDAGIEPEAKIETVNENETVSVENTNVEHETTEIPVNADENLTDAEYNEKYPIHSNDEELSRYQYDSEGNPMHHTNETIDTHTANEPAQESTSSLIDNDSYHLKPEVLTLYNENAEHILKATGHSDWQELVNSRSAEDIMSLKEQYTPEDLSPLVQYMHKLQEVTGLEPRGEDLLSSAETGEHYVARALERAEQISVLDQVKL